MVLRPRTSVSGGPCSFWSLFCSWSVKSRSWFDVVSSPFTIDIFPIVVFVFWCQSWLSRWLFSCLVIFRSRTHGSSFCEWFIYERFVSNFCCSSPPKSSWCTLCRIRRGQPVIVDRLHMAIFVLNRSGSLAQESLEGYWHFSLFSWFEQCFSPLTMNSNQIQFSSFQWTLSVR